MNLLSRMNLWISLPVTMLCLSANAQTTTTTTVATTAPAATSTTAAPKKEEAAAAKFGFVYDLGYSLQSQTQKDGSRSQGLSQTFKPTMKYGEYSTFASIDHDQDLLDSAGGGNVWADPVFGISKKAWTLGEYFKLGPSMSLLLPLKDATRNEVGLIYNVGGALSLSLNTKALGMDAVSLGWQISANKNFTNYDTNAKTGSPNTSHRMRNRLTFGYDFNDTYSFFNMFDFNSTYSVNGVVTNSFFTLQSFGYAVNDNISLSLSHANGGPFLKSGTYQNNLKLYDEENSSYSFGLEVVL